MATKKQKQQFRDSLPYMENMETKHPAKFKIWAISAVITLIIVLVTTIMLWDYDQAIINYGVGMVNKLGILRIVGAICFIISICLIGIPIYKQKLDNINLEKQETIEKETNPFYEESLIITKLTNSIEELNDTDKFDSIMYKLYGNQMITQLNELNEQIDDYHSITDEYQYDIIKSISKELVSAKLRFLENAKSINNRILINNGEDEILRLLDDNMETLNQVKALVLEAINYVDKKSAHTESNLNNLTESLQELIKTIH